MLAASTVSLWVGAVSARAADPDYRYAMFKIESPADNAQAFGINQAGVVCGQAEFTFIHAFTWQPPSGPIEELPSYGSNSRTSWGMEINDLGWVAGYSYTFAPNTAAILWKPDGSVIDLGSLGNSGDAEADDINNSGTVVGVSEDRSLGEPQAFVWKNGVMSRLPGFNFISHAYSINELAAIVGYCDGSEVERWPALWTDEDGDSVYELRPLATAFDGIAYGINEFNEVVGHYQFVFAQGRHAFIWDENTGMRDIHRSSLGYSSGASSINNLGEVVGSLLTDDSPTAFQIAFYWNETTGMTDLKELIPPQTGRWMYWANDINDAGQIVVKSDVPGVYLPRESHLLSPVYPSMTLRAIGHGGALVAGANNALRVNGATPGARITFLWSSNGGGEAIPGCDLQENALQLDSPTLIGTVIANAQGVATLQRFVPSAAQGKTILLQAVAPSGCAISQLMLTTVE